MEFEPPSKEISLDDPAFADLDEPQAPPPGQPTIFQLFPWSLEARRALREPGPDRPFLHTPPLGGFQESRRPEPTGEGGALIGHIIGGQLRVITALPDQ